MEEAAAAAADIQYSPEMLKLLRALYNGVMPELVAIEKAGDDADGVVPDRACISHSTVINEMLRRLNDAGPVSFSAIDDFLKLGAEVPKQHKVDESEGFSRKHPLPPEIFIEERIDQFRAQADAQRALYQTGLHNKKTANADEKLKTMLRGWWDPEADGDEVDNEANETEDDEAAA